MRKLSIILIPLALAGCEAMEIRESQKAPLAQQIDEGRGVASAVCANCHGLDQQDALRADTPALRHVLNNYDAEEGLKIGHPDMPQFHFGPLGADVLLTYLKSIQEPMPAES